jgi:hypothetical protein
MTGERESLFDAAAEKAWVDLAIYHGKRKEWAATRYAAKIADEIRYYRLHQEAINGGECEE